MDKKEIEKRLRGDQWDREALGELAKQAGMEKEWSEADGETFERVAEQMAAKVGITIRYTGEEKKKATHYFEKDLLKKLKVEAAETGVSATEILNDMLRDRYNK